MSKMIFHEREYGIFNYRTAGILLHQNTLLLCKASNVPFRFLPGGRTEFFESSKSGLLRELREELHETFSIQKLLLIAEDTFVGFNNNNVHEIVFYYLVNIPSNSHLLNKSYVSYENNDIRLDFDWFSVDKLEKIDFRPKYIIPYLKQPCKQPLHLIGPGFSNP